jgi:hypothetical protein
MTFTQDNRNNSTITQNSRTSAFSLSQDSKSHFGSGGKVNGALLLPLFLQVSTGGGNFTPDIRH